jgi:hypothetical protein
MSVLKEMSRRRNKSIWLVSHREELAGRVPSVLKVVKEAGFTTLRGNSLFCNSSLNKADNWGKPYVIFPLNGFSYTYSAKFSGMSAAGYTFADDKYAANGWTYDLNRKIRNKLFFDEGPGGI